MILREIRMNKMKNLAMWLGIAIMFVAFMYFVSKEDVLIAKQNNYKICIEAMQKAIPNPNDNGRESFLKNCQNN